MKIRDLIFGICLGIWGFSSALASPVTKEHLLATLEAEKLEKNEQWEAAAKAYQEFYEKDNRLLHALKKSGEMWLAANQPEKAARVWEILKENPYYNLEATLTLGRIYARMGDLEKVVETLTKFQDFRARSLLNSLALEDFDAVRDTPEFQEILSREENSDFPQTTGRPAWSPDGRRIVFPFLREGTSSFDLYTVDLEGETLTRLTQTTQNEVMPDWSPDGKEILYVKGGEGYSAPLGIYAIAPDGKGNRAVVTITSDLEGMPRDFAMPKWCPDGSCLVFLGALDGYFQVFKIDRDGQNLVQLSFTPEDKGNPAFNPANGKVCFDVNREAEFAYQKNYNIECISADGTGEPETLLTDFYWWYPTWSPDGSVFMAGLWGGTGDRFGRLAVIDQETGDFEYLTPSDRDAWWQKISPDNSTIVLSIGEHPFTSIRKLYLMNLDGSGLRPLIP